MTELELLEDIHRMLKMLTAGGSQLGPNPGQSEEGEPNVFPESPDFYRIFGDPRGPDGRNWPINSGEDLAWESARRRFEAVLVKDDFDFWDKVNEVSNYFREFIFPEVISYAGKEYVVFPGTDPGFGTPGVFKMTFDQFNDLHPQNIAARLKAL